MFSTSPTHFPFRHDCAFGSKLKVINWISVWVISLKVNIKTVQRQVITVKLSKKEIVLVFFEWDYYGEILEITKVITIKRVFLQFHHSWTRRRLMLEAHPILIFKGKCCFVCELPSSSLRKLKILILIAHHSWWCSLIESFALVKVALSRLIIKIDIIRCNIFILSIPIRETASTNPMLMIIIIIVIMLIKLEPTKCVGVLLVSLKPLGLVASRPVCGSQHDATGRVIEASQQQIDWQQAAALETTLGRLCDIASDNNWQHFARSTSWLLPTTIGCSSFRTRYAARSLARSIDEWKLIGI